MKQHWLKGLVAGAGLLTVAACGDADEAENNDTANVDEENTGDAGDGLYLTTTFSITADFVEQVLGDRGEVDYIVPIGEEPHEYEPVPSDFRNVSDSAMFITHGMNLEEWLEQIVENASETPITEISEGIDPIPLDEEGENSPPDPHAWLSPKNVDTYIDNITEMLIELDPDGEEEYEANAEAYLEEIDELDQFVEEQTADIPEEHRLIALSENAFKYFGEDYGFDTEGVWEINSHEEGTSGQISRLIDVLSEREVPGVFVETTVDSRYMETVADDADVEIKGELYTDAVGEEGSGQETYVDMIRHNAETIVEGLSE
ncbi:metal ABC transporter solute-binding protein, Zn/Mn family [Salisediminibacterium halotolerans]|uniref:Iron/zinc/copper transport system substrate-binding protein n=1 Tax=Salisediminibacterium halotolerans TaxID=517425 RepID=A0A1H9V9J9_9BACI|nr:zinc ABC transporter substrate-binding protein [Salisediminibacterium haloalkalitolerans]SES18259.1 iron/zinc/copper transport system substrate-binding protein [Salisediminibacterium haloalkalitolerans]